MTPQEFIALSAEAMKVGQIIRTQCPFCGRDRKGFRIAKYEDHVSGKCYHANCHKSALITGNKLLMLGDGTDYKLSKMQQLWKFETVNAYDVPVVAQYIDAKYNIPRHLKAVIKYETNLNALMYPLYDFHCQEIGHEMRKLPRLMAAGVNKDEWRKLPKTKIFWNNAPTIHYTCSNPVNDTVVVVEDWFSAATVSTVLPSVSLMGTSLAYKDMLELRTHYKNVILMLDYDAILTAYKMQEHVGMLFNRAEVVISKQDPKYLSKAELKNLLRAFL